MLIRPYPITDNYGRKYISFRLKLVKISVIIKPASQLKIRWPCRCTRDAHWALARRTRCFLARVVVSLWRQESIRAWYSSHFSRFSLQIHCLNGNISFNQASIRMSTHLSFLAWLLYDPSWCTRSPITELADLFRVRRCMGEIHRSRCRHWHDPRVSLDRKHTREIDCVIETKRENWLCREIELENRE